MAWDEKVTNVNLGGVLAHVKLEGGEPPGPEELAEAADSACDALETAPATAPAWQKGIEDYFGAHLFTR